MKNNSNQPKCHSRNVFGGNQVSFDPRQKIFRLGWTSRRLAGMTIAIIFLIQFFIFSQAKASDLTPFMEANTKYQSGDFKGALELYEKLRSSGKETAALDYNIGNTYFRLGRRGKALLFYERALQILPRNEDVRWNRDIVKTLVIDKIVTSDENLTVYWIKRIADQLTINEISLGLSGLLVLWTIFTGLLFIFRFLKTISRGVGVLFVIIFLPIIILFGTKWIEVKDPRVIILDKEVEARYGPSVKETKAFTLHEGAKAEISDESKDWFHVTLQNQSSGWIPKKACEII